MLSVPQGAGCVSMPHASLVIEPVTLHRSHFSPPIIASSPTFWGAVAHRLCTIGWGMSKTFFQQPTIPNLAKIIADLQEVKSQLAATKRELARTREEARKQNEEVERMASVLWCSPHQSNHLSPPRRAHPCRK